MAERIDLDSLQERDSLNKDLGIEYVELGAGRVVMSMPVEAATSHEWHAAPRADANTQRRLAERIRGEFLEMPGLKLTGS